MSEPVVRLAAITDIGELVDMRHDFTFESDDANASDARPEYETECRAFLTSAIECSGWQIWLAEIDGTIVSHVFIELIDKVPRPTRENRRIAYLTNVYTRPAYRGQGIGAQLIKRAQESAREAKVELMVVWPSEESVEFYKRHGFALPDEPMIWSSLQR